jgi:hypothetical protein
MGKKPGTPSDMLHHDLILLEFRGKNLTRTNGFEWSPFLKQGHDRLSIIKLIFISPALITAVLDLGLIFLPLLAKLDGSSTA